MPVSELTPVTPDPKKNYRTALVLVVVMIVGGIMILKAYGKRAEEGRGDDRPSFVTQISEVKDLMYLRQDGELKELKELKGKVVLVQVILPSEIRFLPNGLHLQKPLLLTWTS